MAVYGTGVEYGAGFVYGEVFYFIDPTSGPVTGGTPVIIAGKNFLETSCDDSFDGVTINPALWVVATNGDASAATEGDGRLHLSAGPVAGNYARITSIDVVGDTDIEVDYFVVTPVLALPPPADVELATIMLRVDDNNYARISRMAGPTFGHRYEAVVVVGGVTIESASLLTSDLEGSLRIIRHDDTVYLLAGTTEVLRRTGFSMADAGSRVAVQNLTANYAVQSDFADFFVHTMVLFGTEPMLDAVVLSDDRLTGTTPPGVKVEAVDIQFATCLEELQDFSDGFNYVDAAQFVILANVTSGQTVDVLITDDPTLRNLRGGRPGFGR